MGTSKRASVSEESQPRKKKLKTDPENARVEPSVVSEVQAKPSAANGEVVATEPKCAPSCAAHPTVGEDLKMPDHAFIGEMLAKVKGDKPTLQYALMLSNSDIKWRMRQLEEYRRLYEQVSAKRGKKPDMQAQKLLYNTIQEKDFAREAMQPPKVIGHVRGVRPGDQFNGRGELAALGIHGQIGCGIDSKQGGPCFCIVMSGGYRDDADDGVSVWYTGQGGRCPKTHKQIEDQKLERGNLALSLSKEHRTPIRVCRAKVKEKGVAKRQGEERQYVYEGLYMVDDYTFVPSEDGPRVYKFKLRAIKGHSTASVQVAFGDFKGGWTKAQMARLARRLQLAPAAPTPIKRTSKGTPHDKLVRAAKDGKLVWHYDNSAAERHALEEVRKLTARKDTRTLMEDISGGQEPVRIPLVVDGPDDVPPPAPPDFAYTADYTHTTPRAAAFIAEYATKGLLQWAGSGHTANAAPAMFKNKVANSVQYNRNGLLEAQWHHTPLVECGDPHCKPQLLNVSERGVHAPLQVFWTGSERGWGVRSEIDLPIGTFVCCYVGRLMLSSEAELLHAEAGADAYLYNLDTFIKSIEVLNELRAAGGRIKASCSLDDTEGITKTELARIPTIPVDFLKWAHDHGLNTHAPSEPRPLPPALSDDIVSAPGSLVHTCLSAQPSPEASMQLAENSPRLNANAPAASVRSQRADTPATAAPDGTQEAAADATAAQATTPRLVESAAASEPPSSVATERRPPADDGLCASWQSYKTLDEVPSWADIEPDLEHLTCDARQVGNVARFINHSCAPNLVKQTIFQRSGGGALLYHTGFFVDKACQAFEELTWDYNYEHVDGKDRACQCGAPNCRGRLH